MGTSFARVLGAEAGVPVAVIEWDGRRYECGPLDQPAKAAFERHLERQAARPVAALEGQVSEARLTALLDRLTERSLEGEFAFGGPAFCRALGIDPASLAPGEGGKVTLRMLDRPGAGRAGAMALAAILFGVDEGEALRLCRARGAEVTAALEKALREAVGPEGNC